MSPKINRRQITEFGIATGVLSASQSPRAFAFSIFGPQADIDKPQGEATCQKHTHNTLPFRPTISIAR
jgi:hypothetical protein